jgi:hypothetical protein
MRPKLDDVMKKLLVSPKPNRSLILPTCRSCPRVRRIAAPAVRMPGLPAGGGR